MNLFFSYTRTLGFVGAQRKDVSPQTAIIANFCATRLRRGEVLALDLVEGPDCDYEGDTQDGEYGKTAHEHNLWAF